jgi:hypothetical protein
MYTFILQNILYELTCYMLHDSCLLKYNIKNVYYSDSYSYSYTKM